MSKVFICYRRSDSQDVVGRIYDHLSFQFGKENIFRDIDNIQVGSSFRNSVKNSLQKCNVVLVVIGPQWAGAINDNGDLRFSDPEDPVRVEIETALSLGCPMIPVFVTNATQPDRKLLPSSIQPLFEKNGLLVRPDPDFHNDISNMIETLSSLGIVAGKKNDQDIIPYTTNPSTFMDENETFSASGRFNSLADNGQLKLPQCERLFLRLIPQAQITPVKSSKKALDIMQLGGVRPMIDSSVGGYFYERNKYGAYACCIDGNQMHGLTQFFKNYELWGIDSSSIDKEYILQLSKINIPHFASAYIEEVFCLTLTNYLKFYREILQIPTPVRLLAGATDVKGYRMYYNGLQGEVLDDHIEYEGMVDDYDLEAPEILRPFFDYFWEECGLNRPDVTVLK